MSENLVWYTLNMDKKIQQFTEKERIAEKQSDGDEIYEYIVSTEGEHFHLEACFPTVEDLVYSWTEHLSVAINSTRLNLFHLEQLKKTIEIEGEGFLRDHIEVG